MALMRAMISPTRRYLHLLGMSAKSVRRRRLTSMYTISGFSTTSTACGKNEESIVSVTFVNRDGQHLRVEGKVGQNLLDVAVNNELDLDGFGACGGSLSCSTCHLILNETDYAKIESRLSDDELDLLDLSTHVTDTSRLGCQVVLTKTLDGMVVRVPQQVTDARELTTGNKLDIVD